MDVKLLRILTATALVLALTGCAGLTDFFKAKQAPRLDPPPKALQSRCQDPVLLPERELTQQEVEAYWGRDRANLIVCTDRHSGLLRFFTVRDAGITGGVK